MFGSSIIALAVAGGIQVNPDSVNRAITMQNYGARRVDSADGGRPVLDLAQFRQDVNERRINRALEELRGDRADGFSQNAGFFLARDLEHVHQEVLEEAFALPTSLELFDIDESVPVGATSFRLRRIYSHGEARVYKGPGDKIPRVGATQREESRPIRHIVCGYAWDIFEAASDGYANAGLLKQLQRICRDAIMELWNRINWGLTGEQYGVYGILNYPWLPKKVIATAFDEATVRADPHAALAELHALVNFPHDFSKSRFQPTDLAMTNAVHDVLSTVPLASGSDTTVLEHFVKNSKHIKSMDNIHIAWELEDAGGAGVDGILAYRKDGRGVQIINPQGITQTPVQQKDLEFSVINYASIGGVVMRDVLNNILGLATT